MAALHGRATGRSATRPHAVERSLADVRRAAATCTACDLYLKATQTVFGEGPTHAMIMLVGEQPGDKEDLAGRPFVGPAGKLLDRALADAGIDRDAVYLTNVVKHFKWIVRGKKRLHQKPNVIQIEACLPWLDAEVARVAPAVILCLGATAAQALLGRAFRVLRQRGQAMTTSYGVAAIATVHPSSLLRIREGTDRERAYRDFVRDLRGAADQASARRRGGSARKVVGA